MIEGLKINDIYYPVNKLLEFSRKKTGDADTSLWERKIFSFILDWFDEGDYIMQNTSGSTGEPKEILLSKSSMIVSAARTLEYFQLKENDTALLCLPVEYIAGKMMIVRAMVGELNLLTIEPKGLPHIPDRIISFTAMVPLQLQNLIRQNIFIEMIDKLLIGGAAVNSYLEKEINKLSTKVYLSYGMSETCSHIALRRLNGNNPEDSFHVLKDVEINTDNSGCLKIKAPLLAAEEIFTTDIVEILSPDCFKFLGRANNIINSGGIKVLPEKLESEIKEFIHGDYVISSVYNDLLGEKIVLVIEGVKEDIDIDDLIAKIKHKAGSKICPKEVLFIPEFPRNINMKISRKSISKIINKDKNPGLNL
jgi:O-succinylbenzoic acid--CoA ligase